MTHSGKSYNCRKALVAAMLEMANGTDRPDLKAILASNTDIPADRLDFAVSEVGQLIFGLRQVAKFLKYVSDTDADLQKNIEDTVAEGTVWTDDDKRDLTVRAYAEKVEGDPLVTVKTKLKGAAK